MSKKKKTILVLFVLITLWMGSVVPQKVEAYTASYTIYVNRKTNIVNVVNNKTKKIARAMYCSTGINYRTIKGTYRTKEKLRWHALYGGVYGQYCTRISGAYLFHSVPYFSVSNKKVETKEYNKLGRQASKGCVRLAVADAKWIYNNCRIGTTVVIGENRKLAVPKRKLLKISTKKSAGWDPTDPNPANPYYPKLKLAKVSYKTVVKGSTFDPRSVISVSSRFTDPDLLLSKVRITGSVDTSRLGSYKIKYSLKDPATELKKTLTVTFTVVNP